MENTLLKGPWKYCNSSVAENFFLCNRNGTESWGWLETITDMETKMNIVLAGKMIFFVTINIYRRYELHTHTPLRLLTTNKKLQ